MVFDRVFLLVFVITCTLGTISIFTQPFFWVCDFGELMERRFCHPPASYLQICIFHTIAFMFLVAKDAFETWRRKDMCRIFSTILNWFVRGHLSTWLYIYTKQLEHTTVGPRGISSTSRQSNHPCGRPNRQWETLAVSSNCRAV